MLLVETLRKKGDVVAMTGDGVNDAPAIKAADIGIAMGSGTEVAKNASRMILSDDNFATIVNAVEEGRKIYDNLNKYVRFVVMALVAFVVTFLGATLLNIAAGQPFSAAQILWINFIVDAPIGAAIGLDKETPGLMLRRPRPRGESIMTHGLMVTVGLVGLYIAICLDVLIAYGHSHYGSYEIGSSIALTAFVFLLVLAAFGSRSETGTLLTMETLDNRTDELDRADRNRVRRAPDPGRLHDAAARHDASSTAASSAWRFCPQSACSSSGSSAS